MLKPEDVESLASIIILQSPRMNALLGREQCSVIQGCSKRWAPGCMKSGERVVFCLPEAGRRMQLFHPIFTQPGSHLLKHLCVWILVVLIWGNSKFGLAAYD